MDRMTEVERDVSRMAAYWGERKAVWRSAASDEFGRIVMPQVFFEDEPSEDRLDAINLCFTEWVLFERPMRRGRTPLQLYVGRAPDGVSADAVSRLRQVEQTQFFSRFAILSKDVECGMARLLDVRGGGEYEVLDRCLCSNERWMDGTIAERLALVDDLWLMVGQARLYDRAPLEETMRDGPGELHPEDRDKPLVCEASYFLRLVRDVMGVDGRYAPSLSLYKLDN